MVCLSSQTGQSWRASDRECAQGVELRVQDLPPFGGENPKWPYSLPALQIPDTNEPVFGACEGGPSLVSPFDPEGNNPLSLLLSRFDR